MIKKKITLIMLIGIIAVLFISCSGGSYKTFMSTETNGANSISMSHSSFKGYKYRTLKLKEGEKVTLNVDILTEKGEMNVLVFDEEGKKLLDIKNPKEEISKTFNIEKDGKYKVQVEGDHSGTAEISWDIEEP